MNTHGTSSDTGAGLARTARLLLGLARLSCRRPAITVALALLAAVAGFGYTIHALTFKTSTRSLLPQNAPYVTRYTQYAQDFGELEDIVVVVEARSFEGAREYAVRLAEELRQSPVPFKRIAYRIDPTRFEGRQLLYLPTDKLKEIRDKIFDHQEFMESFAGDPSLARLLEGVNTQMASAFVSNLFDLGLQDKDLPVDTRFLRELLDQISTRLERPGPYRSPWGTLFSFGDPPAEAGYFLSDDKSLLFILVETPESQKGSFVGDREAIETIRGALAKLRVAFPNIQAGVTGVPALSNDEMTAAFHDSEVATAMAAILTLLVMSLAFGRLGKPLLMLGVLVVTLGWSMGITTLTVGHLTLFSVMFIPIVIGIGIDYGNYFLFRYQEEIFLGRGLRQALELTAARSGPGMLISTVTAGGTFLVLLLTDFRGIQELGLIAGISILLAGVGMLTVFPAVLRLVDQRTGAAVSGPKRPIPSSSLTFPRWSASPVFRAPCWSARAGHRVLGLGRPPGGIRLQRPEPPGQGDGVRALGEAHPRQHRPVGCEWTLVGGQPRGAQEEAGGLRELPTVSEVDSVLRVIPDDQDEKIDVIKSFAPLVAPVTVSAARARSTSRDSRRP